MEIGIGLPTCLPGTRPDAVLEWAVRADQGPYSSLAVLDRVLYDSFDSLTCLAAAAAVTSRVSLATTILVTPLRNEVLLAKQSATLHRLSGGRFVLGVGLGARTDDYRATGTPYRTRGQRLSDQLLKMHEVWDDGRIGSSGWRPRLLVGGSGGLAMSRMARYSNGYVHGGGPPRAFARGAAEARAAWEDFGRSGRPMLWGMAYFQLVGDRRLGNAYLRDYYAFTGAFADKIAAGLLTTGKQLREFAAEYAAAGCDNLVLFPASPDRDQLEALAGEISGS
ncbi:MAG: LLM class flavin-dependent oxidoreductase [Chloroflexota bacterium]